MKTWLIAGAQSGVGKTTLVRKLTEILPNSEFLKIGHSPRRKTGPANYFTSADKALDFISRQEVGFDHCVVESNRLVGKLDADVVIFLDREEGDRRHDADRLRKCADIILGYQGNRNKWGKVISALELPPDVSKGVIKVFKAQHKYLTSSRISLRTKIWLRRDGKVVFGEGLARLLYGIDHLGSLSRAAKEEGTSYRHAWGDIKRAEERLGFPLLERSVGGVAGGGSRLTEKGHQLLKGYEAIKRRSIRESDRWFRELFRDIIDGL